MVPVPQSVLAYFTQFDVQTAVDLMSGSKDPKVPPTLRWQDLGNFYRARLAALQVPVEYAIFLEALHQAVWLDVPAKWRPDKPSAPARPDLSIGISTVWDESCFTRRFTCGSHSLELMVGLGEEEGLQLGVLLYDGDEEVVLDGDLLSGWSQPEGIDTFWTEEAITPLNETIAPEPFKRWTDQAWTAIDAALPSG